MLELAVEVNEDEEVVTVEVTTVEVVVVEDPKSEITSDVSDGVPTYPATDRSNREDSATANQMDLQLTWRAGVSIAILSIDQDLQQHQLEHPHVKCSEMPPHANSSRFQGDTSNIVLVYQLAYQHAAHKFLVPHVVAATNSDTLDTSLRIENKEASCGLQVAPELTVTSLVPTATGSPNWILSVPASEQLRTCPNLRQLFSKAWPLGAWESYFGGQHDELEQVPPCAKRRGATGVNIG